MHSTSHRPKLYLLLITALLFGITLPGQPVYALDDQASTPALQPQSSALELKCKLEPQSWVNAGFSIPGRIEQLYVATGDSVEAGQPLAELSNPQQYQAAIAAAELQVLLAQQALDRLNEQAAHQLALAEQDLAQAGKAVETATWQAESVKRPFSQLAINQAYANQLLAKKQLDKLRKDLFKLEKLVSDRRNIIWNFVKRKLFKQQVLFLQSALADAEGRYQDAVQKYKDRQKPPDPIDVAQAEANLAAVQAQADYARLERDRLASGPDPGELARLQAELQAAQANLVVARSASEAAHLNAPIAGQVVEVQTKAGEWASPGQTVLMIADLDHWLVQCDELTQEEIVALQPDQAVQVQLDALPDLSLPGKVTTIGYTYREIRDEARFLAEIDLGSDDPSLRWGMTARVSLAPTSQ